MKTISILGTRAFVLVVILSVGLGFVFPAVAGTSVIVNPDGKLTYLGTLGGNSTVATDINDSGQVVGYSFTTANNSDSRHAFITGANGMGMTDLGTLGGDYSRAFGINAAGRVVGESLTAKGVRHAFITGANGVGMTDLGALDGTSSFATDINDAGQVVGGSGDRSFITGPNGEGRLYLPALPRETSSFATSINNAGQVVGQSRGESASGPFGLYIHAFMTGPGGRGMKDLGAPNGAGTSADAINDAGQVAGDLIPSALGWAPPLSFITGPDGMGMISLGWPDGWLGNNVTDINDAGQLVGYSFLSLSESDSGHPHAYIAGPGGVGMTNLNSYADLPDGHFLTSAEGINNLGQVIATISPIPEPASYALLLAGLGLVGFMARRKRPEKNTLERC